VSFSIITRFQLKLNDRVDVCFLPIFDVRRTMLRGVVIFAMGSVSFGHVHCRLLCISGNDSFTTIENLKQMRVVV